MRKHCRDCFSLQRGSGNRAASHIRFAVRMSRQSRQTSLVSEERSFTPPTDANAIQAVTPSDMYSWPGPDIRLTQQSERTGIENKWFALTGRVVALNVETDGDLHIALQDAAGDKPGIVVVEVPAKPQWCSIRETVFSWTRKRFPFHTSSAKKLKVDQPPVITVIGKVFWDVGNAPKDQSNRRKYLPGYAAWEIHPMMKLTVPC